MLEEASLSLASAFGVQAVLDAAPECGVIQGDINNGYNEVAREGVLASIRESEKLDDTLAFSHALLLPEVYVCMDNVGTSLITAHHSKTLLVYIGSN